MNSPIEEKYLCEIYYAVERNGYVRISELAKFLNVTASYVSKIAKRLNQIELIEFERYGVITLTKKGFLVGKRLATRREILVQFYKLIGVEEGYVEKEVKNIENQMSDHVVGRIELFLKKQKISKIIYVSHSRQSGAAIQWLPLCSLSDSLSTYSIYNLVNHSVQFDR